MGLFTGLAEETNAHKHTYTVPSTIIGTPRQSSSIFLVMFYIFKFTKLGLDIHFRNDVEVQVGFGHVDRTYYS